MQNNRWLQILLVLLVIIASLYLASIMWSFIVQFSTVILLFFLSWLLAFILRPSARWLNNRGLSYGMSVLVVYLVLALAVTLAGFLLIPTITQQTAQLGENFDDYLTEGQKLVNDIQNLLMSWGASTVDIGNFYSELAGQIQTVGMTALSNTVSILQGVATLLFQFILVLLLSFYFMKDGAQIFGNILNLLPPRWQDEARLLAMSVEKSFGAFVRGQLLFAVVYALLNGVIMLGFGLDYVLIASIVAGFSMLIPLVGNFIAFIPPVLACLVTPGKEGMWFWVLLVCFIMQSIQMNVIGPRIMSNAIGLHPMYVMAAMLVGAQVAGLWGALFGIPVAGVINLVGRPLMRRVRYQTTLYEETQSGYLTTRQFATGPLRASAVDEYEKLQKAKVVGRASSETVEPVESEEAVDALSGASTPEDSETPEVAEKVTASIPVSQAPLSSPYDYDYGEPARPRTPTLTARLWHFAWLLVSRAYSWVGARAHIRPSRRS